jgi:hypothetical protein
VRCAAVTHETQTSIVEHLMQVARERQLRESQPHLLAAVQAVKHYQQQRFTRTYADLLASSRYSAAASFFLDELYGPKDFGQRDAQFMRVVPLMVRMLPAQLVHTLDILARLHAVSEALDSAMGSHLATDRIDARSYIRAWQLTGQPAQRETQIALTQEVGAALDFYVRKPLLGRTLRMMRGPARAAGFGELQHFLEAGFDAFKSMRGAEEFLNCIGQRERELARSLFDAALPPNRINVQGSGTAIACALLDLP